MTEFTIHLERAVLHLVDPFGDAGFQLSDRQLPVEAGSDVEAFLVGHVRRASEDPKARAACFVGHPNRSPLEKLSIRLRSRSGEFLRASREIATRLYSIAKKDRRISGATLAVLEYKTESGRWVGILKLDRSRAFRPTVRKEGGVHVVTLKAVHNIVPTRGERLQKCAFIHLAGEPLDYDLIVLDRQQPSRDEPARFFTERFLGAEPYLDDRECTRRFYDALIVAHNLLRPSLSTPQADDLRHALETALQRKQIDVDAWIRSLRLNDDAKSALRAGLRKELPNKSFRVDAEVAHSLTRLRKFRGEHGFELTVDTHSYDRLFVESPASIPNREHGTVTRLHLRVRSFREQP